MSKRKLVFLIPDLGPGGMERVMSELIAYFSQKPELDCYLILYGKSPEIFYELAENVVVIKCDFPFQDTKRKWMAIKTIGFIRKSVQLIKPDAILSFGEIWNNLVMISMWGLKFPIYVSDRCKPDKSFGFIHNKLRQALYPKAQGIIAQTSLAKTIYDKQFRSVNIQVIGNPIRSIENEKKRQRENIVLSIGRLIKTKHFDRLINIFKNSKAHNWKLVIVGGDVNKGTNSLTLQKMIDDNDLQDQITLAGTQKNVEDYLVRASIFAFTSSSEGFPNVIGEAMSAGLPVVAYDCVAGPSDMIENEKNGYLIPLFDDRLFEEKLSYLMTNTIERERMGNYAKESIQKFNIGNIGEKYYNLLFPKK